MAAKTNIDVDVNSAEFQDFADKFAKYAAILATVPDLWKKAGQSAATVKTKFEETAASAGLVSGSMAAIHGSAKEFHQITISTGRYWKDLALSTAGVAKNIVAATESLLKWTGIVGVVTGAGGLFGFDRLAHSVAGQRTGALGVGTDYASRAAFSTAFRRLGDPEGFLGRVSEDISSMGPQLRRLGLSQAELKGDTTDVAIRALRKGAQIAAKTRTDLLDVVPQLQIFSHEERMRLKTHPEEIEEMAGKVPQFRKELALSPADQKAYTDFTTQMERASRSIETIFVKGLVRLADPLKNLSSEVVKLVEKFMARGGPLDALIVDLGKGIDWLAGEIDKPEFQKTVNDFIAGVGSLAASLGSLVTGILKFASWLGIGTGASSQVAASFGTPDSSGISSAPGLSLRGEGGGEGGAGRGAFGHRPAGGGSDLGGGGSGINKRNTEAAQDAMNYLIKEKGFTPEGASTAVGQILTEDPAFSLASAGGGGDQGSAHGLFQWRKERYAALQSYLAGHGGDTVHHELDFFSEEIKTHKGRGGPEAGWRQAHSIEEGNRYGYSFEGYAGGIQKRREQDSRRMFELYNRPTIEKPREQESRRAPEVTNKLTTNKPKVTIRNNPGGNTVDAANAAAAGSP